MAPPPPDPAPNAPARAGGPPQIPQMPGGIPSPIPRPTTGVRAGDWNTVEFVLDADILRTFLNDAGGIGDSVAEPEYRLPFGPFALFVGGTGEVRFKDVSTEESSSRASRRPRAGVDPIPDAGPSTTSTTRGGRPWPISIATARPTSSPARITTSVPTTTRHADIYVGGTIDPGTQSLNGLQSRTTSLVTGG